MKYSILLNMDYKCRIRYVMVYLPFLVFFSLSLIFEPVIYVRHYRCLVLACQHKLYIAYRLLKSFVLKDTSSLFIISINIWRGTTNNGLTRKKTWLWISWILLLTALEFSCSKIASIIPCCRIDCNNVCNYFARGMSSSCLICSLRTTTVENCWNNDVPAAITRSLFCVGALSRWRTARYPCWTELASY